jgi:hypothetical protein
MCAKWRRTYWAPTLNDNAIQLSNKIIISICVHYFDNEAFVTKSSYEHLFLYFIQKHAHKVSKHPYESPYNIGIFLWIHSFPQPKDKFSLHSSLSKHSSSSRFIWMLSLIPSFFYLVGSILQPVRQFCSPSFTWCGRTILIAVLLFPVICLYSFQCLF